MKKTKYYYNTSSLTYEQVTETWQTKAWRVVRFLSAAFVFGVVLLLLSSYFFDSPKERRLSRELNKMEMTYANMNEKMTTMSDILSELEEKDDNIYRVIFEAEPISPAVRKAGVGGSDRYKDLEGFDQSKMMEQTAKKLDKLYTKIGIQSMSYEELTASIRNKSKMLNSIPSIQPVANKELKRIASGYGYRIHPVHKVRKFHRGVDFTAPTGTEVFATGDGKIVKASRSRRGYGNKIVVDHGYGYRSLYAHLNTIDVKKGQIVKRGEKIGTVGSSGLSTAPHLHYEVHHEDKAINPINFFHNDLDETQFEKMIQLANRSNQSFD